MSDKPAHQDLARTTLGIFFIVLLAGASLWVLRPFLPALVWATMIVVATWPLMLRVQNRMKGKRKPAVAVMTVAIILIFVIPFSLAVGTIADNAGSITQWLRGVPNISLPDPPSWVRDLPVVGDNLDEGWRQLTAAGPDELNAKLMPHVRKLVGWFLAQAGSFGVMFIHFLLTAVLAAILYRNGEKAAEGVRNFAHKLAGERGENATILAGQAIRAVALGVIVTAVVQSLLAGIGLAVAGIPYAGLLTAVIFVLAIAQIGPGPVLIPAVIWVYWKGDPLWGTILLVWTVAVGSLDNILRPMLIKRGANLPLILIFGGVIGGLIAFGIIGLFIGPVVLAVTFTLFAAWIQDSELAVAGVTKTTEIGSQDDTH